MFRWRRITSGEMVALATVILVAVVMVTRGETMFSPGALNAKSRQGAPLGGVHSHAEIASNCSACHVSPWSGQTMADRCLECHADVRRQIDTGSAMHGKLADGMQCRNCHTEHKGPHAELTNFDRFDHSYAAFQLTGKHLAVECQACHANNVFKGTATTCIGCHGEPEVHKGRFGTDCAGCHSTETWKGSTLGVGNLANFDHDRTGFKLTGKHKTADCRSCHVNNVFKGTARTCVSCHAEPPVPKVHKFRYGTGCASCHSTEVWTGAKFTHSAFSITHGSRSNTCSTCHTDLNHFEKYTCYNCHKHTPERMERVHARRNIVNFQDCARCHGRNRRGRMRERADLHSETWLDALGKHNLQNDRLTDLLGDTGLVPK